MQKAWSKNQSLSMRRLAISNSNISEIDIFKNILSDLSTGNPDNLAPGHEERTEPTLPDVLVAERLKNVGKKKAKGQALTKRLSLKRNSMKKRPKGCKIPMHPPIAIKLIKPGKQKTKV